MDSTTIFILVSAIAGVCIGAAIAWLAALSAQRSAVETATLKTQAESQDELSRLRERVRSQEEMLAQESLSQSELETRFDKQREELDAARDEVSKLAERAARVPELEQGVARTADEMRKQGEELRRVSADASEKAAIAQSGAQKIESLEIDLGNARQQVIQANESVNSLTAQKATLEEQVSRIPSLENELTSARQQLQEKHEALARVSERRAALEEQNLRIPALEDELREAKQACANAESEVTRLTALVSQLETKLHAELKASQEKLALLEDAKNTLSEQFRNVANDLLEEKSKKFAEQNQANLGQLLDPLRLQITEFKGKVEEVYVQESKDRSAMGEQVRQLVALNQALSQEAKNLTNALKGNTKAQGNWGELVLERVLEASGLRKGEEYIVQDSQTREDGSRAQPDVVIMLPEQRKLVVDSKVSLIAYEEYTVAESDEERMIAARRHLESVRKHVQGLSTKAYEKLYGNGLDFVLMFIPIEPAFMLAISNDDRLFMDAWDRNVLLVSPSTLLFVVRTVAHLWRQEQQTRNAQDIAKRGAELYDKLVDFVKDLEQVGNRLQQAKDSYDEAHKRLATGKGNVIRQAEMLRSLGVKATKKLPTLLVEGSSNTISVTEEQDATPARLALPELDSEVEISLLPGDFSQTVEKVAE